MLPPAHRTEDARRTMPNGIAAKSRKAVLLELCARIGFTPPA
jgi:hypothetical protein